MAKFSFLQLKLVLTYYNNVNSVFPVVIFSGKLTSEE